MRHVDEGTIHAWLDAQVTDAAEAGWVSAHLRACAACRARVDEERATRDQADALLALALPGADADRPPFDAIAARAARAAGSDRQVQPVPLRGTRLRTWAVPVGWAASVALAVGIGWMARDLSERRPASRTTVPSAPPAVAANEPDRSIGPVGAIRSTAEPAPEPRPAPQRGGTAAAKPHDAPRVERPAFAVEASRQEPSGDPARRAPLPSTSPVVPLSNPGTPVLSQPVAAGLAGTPLYQGRSVSVSPAPELLQAPGTPQFGRVPVRGEVATVPAGGARNAAPAAARGASRPLTGTLFAGTTPASFGSAAADGISWRVLPRTDAAARSGMALYGIAGLTPVVTTLSSDNAIVRTLYRLESGENVELMQQKIQYFANPAASSGLVSALAQPAKEAPLPDGPPAWSVLRDNVRVTLRGAAKPEALTERLRLD